MKKWIIDFVSLLYFFASCIFLLVLLQPRERILLINHLFLFLEESVTRKHIVVTILFLFFSFLLLSLLLLFAKWRLSSEFKILELI
jgi:hypothetical protein